MILYWASNAPHVGSGYGNQTDLFTRCAVRDGHKVVIRATYGLSGRSMMDEGRLVLPGSYHSYGDDVIGLDYDKIAPDVGVVLFDSWVFTSATVKKPLAFWAPMDHHEIVPAVAKNLIQATFVWAMSRHGEREMRKVGIDPFYVPHGVDTDVFRPIDRVKVRDEMGVDQGRFVAVMVAANKGFPDRKNFRGMFKAWAEFIKDHPDALLYVHAVSLSVYDGMDLEHLRKFYGIPEENIKFADIYTLINGGYDGDALNDWYNVADVFVLPSNGEGFGIPALEAQASGCPVILSDFGTQSELIGSGWKIEIDALDDMWYTTQLGEQAMAKPSAILACLRDAKKAQGEEGFRNKARQFAMDYDYREVWAKYMKPAMLMMAGQADSTAKKADVTKPQTIEASVEGV